MPCLPQPSSAEDRAGGDAKQGTDTPKNGTNNQNKGERKNKNKNKNKNKDKNENENKNKNKNSNTNNHEGLRTANSSVGSSSAISLRTVGGGVPAARTCQ